MKKILKLIELFTKRQKREPKLKVCKCERCGSRNVGTTMNAFSRGWNNLCEQSVGDTGAYCKRCGHVTFARTLEEFKKSLPDWCKAYEPKI